MTTPDDYTLAIRLARADEDPALRRLAELDDAPPLHGDVLIALVDGEAVAAASLSDGRAVANPFLPTADLVAMLSLRARQLGRRRAPWRPWRVPRLRAA
jgi:hypothetical protein